MTPDDGDGAAPPSDTVADDTDTTSRVVTTDRAPAGGRVRFADAGDDEDADRDEGAVGGAARAGDDLDALERDRANRAAWGADARAQRRRKATILMLIALVGLLLRVYMVLVAHPACPGDDEAWASGAAVDHANLNATLTKARVSGPNGCFQLGGDPLATAGQARFIADGHGMSSEVVFALSGRYEPGAARPPSWQFTLAGLNMLGFKTPTHERLLASLLGALAVVVIGHVAWCLGGRNAGIAAAVIAAFNPNLWINDFRLLSDGPYALVGACALWLAYRMWVRPTYGRAAALGAVIALGYFTRSEALALVFLLPIPLAYFLKGLTLKRRAALGGVAVLVGIGLIAPYFMWNYSRFDKKSITLGTGTLLLNASCDDTYYGKYMGMVGFSCFDERTKGALVEIAVVPGTDESTADAQFGEIARAYVKANVRRLPFVALVRVARVYQVYAPGENASFDAAIERRGDWEPFAALYAYYALIPFTIAGLCHLRRRRIPINPFVAMFVVVTLAVAWSFGLSRYRVSFDIAMCILGGIGVAALLRWIGDVRRARADDPAADGYVVATVHAASGMGRRLVTRVRGVGTRWRIATAAAVVLFAAVMLVSWTADPDPAYSLSAPVDLGAIAGGTTGTPTTKPAAALPECQVIVNNRALFTEFTQHVSGGKLDHPGQLLVAFDRLNTTTQDETFRADTKTMRDVIQIAKDQNLPMLDAAKTQGPEGSKTFIDALERVLRFVNNNCPQLK